MTIFHELWTLVGYSRMISQYLEEHKHAFGMMDTWTDLEKEIAKFQHSVDRKLKIMGVYEAYYYIIFHYKEEVAKHNNLLEKFELSPDPSKKHLYEKMRFTWLSLVDVLRNFSSDPKVSFEPQNHE